jgi:hypothetical protein
MCKSAILRSREAARAASPPRNRQQAPDVARVGLVPAAEIVADAVDGLHEAAAARGIDIGPDTNLPWWDGAQPDFTWATEIVHAAIRPMAPHNV